MVFRMETGENILSLFFLSMQIYYSQHQDKYHITQALKFSDYNLGREGALLTLPSYMGFLLEFEDVEDIELPNLIM